MDEFPPCNDDLDTEFRLVLAHDYGSQPTVPVPLDKFTAVCAELEAASHIMGKSIKYFTRKPDASNIRKHRAQCDALRSALQRLIPPMLHYPASIAEVYSDPNERS